MPNSYEFGIIRSRHFEIKVEELDAYRQAAEEVGWIIVAALLPDDKGLVYPLPASHDEEYEPEPYRPKEGCVVIQPTYSIEAEKQGIPGKFRTRVNELLAQKK